MATPGTVVYRQTTKALQALPSSNGEVASGKKVLSDADIATLTSIARRHKQLTDRLDRLRRGKSKNKLKQTQAVYLEAFTTRVCATVRAFAKTRRRASLGDIYQFAERLDIRQPLKERVRVRLLPKAKGGYRRISLDGPRRMAQRFMLRDLLSALGIDNEFDYARPGAGGEKAMIGDVCQRIEKGYGHWQTVDIKECFASLKPRHLSWLPIPKKLIRNVVYLPKCARVGIVEKSDGAMSGMIGEAPKWSLSPSSVALIKKEAMKKVRRELPQGSVLSPLVARAFVGRELRAALGHHEVARFSFVDDLTLGARSRPQVDQALDDLRERLLGHPAGPILLHVDPPTSTKEGRVLVFNYVLEPGRGYGDNFVHVRPGRVRFHRFHKKLYRRWKAAGLPDDADALEQFILERLKHWIPSQQAWTLVPVYSKHLALTFAFMYVCEKEGGTGATVPHFAPVLDSVDDILPFLQAKMSAPASPASSGFMPTTSAELHAEVD